MQAWTYQQGYPLLTATVDGDGNVYLQQVSGVLSLNNSHAYL